MKNTISVQSPENVCCNISSESETDYLVGKPSGFRKPPLQKVCTSCIIHFVKVERLQRNNPGLEGLFALSLFYAGKGGTNRTMRSKSFAVRLLLCAAALALVLAAPGACGAEEAPAVKFPEGDWAFNYEPTVSALQVREDGTAVFRGAEYTLADDGEFLTLTDGETELRFRYQVTEEKLLLYMPQEYTRAKEYPGQGLTGAWIGKESEGTTFIFREDYRFLEDGTFTGAYQVDPEKGTVLLTYIKYFDDTLCYFSLEGEDGLTVEYPWPMVEKQTDPA